MHLFFLEYIRGSSAQVVIALSLGVVIDGDIRMFAMHRVLFEIREAIPFVDCVGERPSWCG